MSCSERPFWPGPRCTKGHNRHEGPSVRDGTRSPHMAKSSASPASRGCELKAHTAIFSDLEDWHSFLRKIKAAASKSQGKQTFACTADQRPKAVILMEDNLIISSKQP